jgi:hypothetical protein
MPVIGCALSSAPALNVTGDASVDPLTGEQILTVSLTVELHVCDHAAVPLNITAISTSPAAGRAPWRKILFTLQMACIKNIIAAFPLKNLN